MALAERLVEANKILNRPTNLQEFGFDFTLDHLQRYLHRKQRINATLEKARCVKFGHKPDVIIEDHQDRAA